MNQPQFNPETKLTRSVKKALRAKQLKGVQMAVSGGQTIIQNMDVMTANQEDLQEELIQLFYTNLPDGWQEDDELVEQLYTPIAELDPLGSKKLTQSKTMS